MVLIICFRFNMCFSSVHTGVINCNAARHKHSNYSLSFRKTVPYEPIITLLLMNMKFSRKSVTRHSQLDKPLTSFIVELSTALKYCVKKLCLN